MVALGKGVFLMSEVPLYPITYKKRQPCHIQLQRNLSAR